MSKSAALLVGLLLIALFGGLAFLLPERIAALPPVLKAVVTLVSAYIGLQVVNNGVRGKFFNPELYEAENSEDGKNEPC